LSAAAALWLGLRPRCAWRVLAAAVLCLGLAGCEQILSRQRENEFRQAKQLDAASDYPGAIASYEAVLDNSPRGAEAHFRLALIYMDKINDPVSAVHHLRRYLAMAPKGQYAKDARANLERSEVLLATAAGGGALISRSEAIKLKNENEELRRQLAGRLTPPASASPSPPAPGSAAAKEAERRAKAGAGATRTYQVVPGDTLAGIAKKVYRNKARYKDIQDANLNTLGNPPKLRPGMTLVIP